MTSKELYKALPHPIKTVLINSEGWLVGTSIATIYEGGQPKDYDIIVEDPQLFAKTVAFLNNVTFDNSINTFGGIKFKISEDISVDIWCEKLGHFLQNCSYFTFAYSLTKSKLIRA